MPYADAVAIYFAAMIFFMLISPFLLSRQMIYSAIVYAIRFHYAIDSHFLTSFLFHIRYDIIIYAIISISIISH